MSKNTNKNIFYILIVTISLSVSTVKSDCPNDTNNPPSRHFVLVHGACLGGWSWYKLVAMLGSAGHCVTAVDLAGNGVDTTPIEEIRSFSDYFRPLIEKMAQIPDEERVVLVGHSLGGLAVSQAMETFPGKIVVAVFVTAAMPAPSLDSSLYIRQVNAFMGVGLSVNERLKRESLETDYPPTYIISPTDLAETLYQLSPPQDLELGTMLVRPIRLVHDVPKLTPEKYGTVKRVFVIAGEDKRADLNMQCEIIAGNPPDKVYKVDAADHMVMVSQPGQLFAHLQLVALEFF